MTTRTATSTPSVASGPVGEATSRRSYRNLDAFQTDDGKTYVDEGRGRVIEYVPAGPGTPHGRMKAAWARMAEDEDAVRRLTAYNPASSRYPLECAYVDAFRLAYADALDAGEASRQAAYWQTRAIALGADADEYERFCRRGTTTDD